MGFLPPPFPFINNPVKLRARFFDFFFGGGGGVWECGKAPSYNQIKANICNTVVQLL